MDLKYIGILGNVAFFQETANGIKVVLKHLPKGFKVVLDISCK
jgi:hypothetical protein